MDLRKLKSTSTTTLKDLNESTSTEKNWTFTRNDDERQDGTSFYKFAYGVRILFQFSIFIADLFTNYFSFSFNTLCSFCFSHSTWRDVINKSHFLASVVAVKRQTHGKCIMSLRRRKVISVKPSTCFFLSYVQTPSLAQAKYTRAATG